MLSTLLSSVGELSNTLLDRKNMFNKKAYEVINELTDAIYILSENIMALKEDVAELTSELLDD